MSKDAYKVSRENYPGKTRTHCIYRNEFNALDRRDRDNEICACLDKNDADLICRLMNDNYKIMGGVG